MSSKVFTHIRLFVAMLPLLMLPAKGQAQDRRFFTLFPGISVSAPLTGKVELNLSSYIQYNAFSMEHQGTDFPAAINYYDVQLGGVFKPGQRLHYAAAWYFRNTDPGRSSSSAENRFWQQVTILSRLDNLRLRNRFRLEERLITRKGQAEPLRWRFRYQTGLEVPLQGEKTDIKEFYLTLLNEAYFSLNKPRPAFWGENWVSAILGYRISAKSRLESGPVWQMQIRNAAGDQTHSFHLQVNLIIQTELLKRK